MTKTRHQVEMQLQSEATLIAGNLPNLAGLPKALDPKEFEGARGRFDDAYQSVVHQEAALFEARTNLRLRRRSLRKLIKRVRNGVLAVYGDDAPELEMVGAKRISQHKRPVRPKKSAKTA
jgi:hypothetical protein